VASGQVDWKHVIPDPFNRRYFGLVILCLFINGAVCLILTVMWRLSYFYWNIFFVQIVEISFSCNLFLHSLAALTRFFKYTTIVIFGDNLKADSIKGKDACSFSNWNHAWMSSSSRAFRLYFGLHSSAWNGIITCAIRQITCAVGLKAARLKSTLSRVIDNLCPDTHPFIR